MNQTALFLLKAKEIVKSQGLVLVPRDQNIEFLASMGWSTHDLELLILGLEARDCFDGPEPDRDSDLREWTVAEFSPVANGKTLYLKISIRLAPDACKCLSVKLYRERP